MLAAACGHAAPTARAPCPLPACPVPDPASALAARLDEVREVIARAAARAGRAPDAVRLVVVTKSAPPGIFALAHGAGVTDVGESRLPAALARMRGWERAFQWHFVGHVQSNKARRVVAAFDVLHGIDSGALLARVDAAATELRRAPRVLLQVNVSGEGTKSGLRPPDVLPVVRASAGLRAARLVGLMTMAPRVDEAEAARPVFAGLRALRDEVQARAGLPLPELSMGMSEDFPIAVEEGATLVRLGTRLVGGLLRDALP